MADTADPQQNKLRRRGNTGCITCRIRRVKCDEAKPSCKRCTSTGRKCDGYPGPKKQQPVAFLVVVSGMSQPNYDGQAANAFQFFYEVCAPSLDNHGSGDFWNRLVLQACHIDESIKHLVIAASRLEIEDHRPKNSDSSDPLFLWHYGKALRLLTQAKNPDPAQVLIACLLLVLCSELQQNPYAALQHVAAGRKILSAYYPGGAQQGRGVIAEEIGPIFSKIELHTGEFRQQVAPRHSRWPLPVGGDPAIVQNIQYFLHLQDSSPFQNVHEAAISLQAIAFDCVTSRYQGSPPRTSFHTAQSLTTRLNDWLERLTLFQARIPEEDALRSFRDRNVLNTYHLCLHVMSRCTPYNREMAFDLYTGNLEHIMVSCGLLMSCSTTKVLPVLFFVATRYRNASYRRRAVEFLRRCGLDGQLLAKIATAIIRIEEKGVAEPIVCSDIPKQNRVRIQSLELDPETAFYTLYFQRYPYEDGLTSDHLSFPSHGFAWGDNGSVPHYASQLLEAVQKMDFMSFWWNNDPS